MPAPEIVALQELQVRRKHYIRTANRLGNAAGALVRRALGWSLELSESERARIVKRAAAIVSAVLDGEAMAREDDEMVRAHLATDILVMKAAREPLDAERDRVEKEMKRLARKLPAYAFWAGVRGAGDLGLAVLVGEAGDLSRYPHPDKLKKRLGLAPYAGHAASTWRRKGGLSAEEWSAFGYAPRRRAEIYGVIETWVLVGQSPKFDKNTGELVREAGPYRVIYDRRKARTNETHPDWTKAHANADAMRVMVQALVTDLWSEWRRASEGVPAQAGQSLPAATEFSVAAE